MYARGKDFGGARRSTARLYVHMRQAGLARMKQDFTKKLLPTLTWGRYGARGTFCAPSRTFWTGSDIFAETQGRQFLCCFLFEKQQKEVLDLENLVKHMVMLLLKSYSILLLSN
jgi:hypothetical protein